jgi:hypothetical protein
MNLEEGARILAARIASSDENVDADQRRWSPDGPPRSDSRCASCGREMAEVLVVLGSLRCHDCRSASGTTGI